MKDKKYFFVIFLFSMLCFTACKTQKSNLEDYNKTQKRDVKEIYKTNKIYYLCYIEEEPVFYAADALLKNSYPPYLEGQGRMFIKLKLRVVDLYFTELSRRAFLGLQLTSRRGLPRQSDEPSTGPIKENYLNFNLVYYVAKNSSEINMLKKSFKSKDLILIDRVWPYTDDDINYHFSTNAYPIEKVNFKKLYPFHSISEELKNN